MTTTFQTQLPSPTESRVTPPEESEVAVLAELVQVLDFYSFSSVLFWTDLCRLLLTG